MFVLGFVLFGSTMLLPLMLQMLMGYSAMDAGMALSPGGMVTMAMMPIIGILVGKFQPRLMVGFGLLMVSLSMFYLSGFTLDTDFKHAVYSRMIMGFGLAFLFVPINTLAYAFLPRDKNNAASGLINLARNLGGSFGIAITTTMLSRWAQVHQTALVGHLTPYDPAYRTALHGAMRAVSAHTADPVQAMAQAQGLLYGSVQRHANMMAFIDNYRSLGILFLVMIPMVLLMKRGHGHGGAMH